MNLPHGMTRSVSTTARFRKNHALFLRKYASIAKSLSDFLEFRDTARPDMPFGPKDSPMQTTPGFRRLHLVAGKAILIYALVGSDIRLADIVEHNSIEHGAALMQLRRWALGLADADFTVIEPAVPDALVPAQVQAIRCELYAMAANPQDRHALAAAQEGAMEDLLDYARMAAGDEELALAAVVTAFGGADQLRAAIRLILAQIGADGTPMAQAA